MLSKNKNFVNFSYYFVIGVSILWYSFFAIGMTYSGFKYEIPMFRTIGIAMMIGAILNPLLIHFLDKRFPDKE
ncbi:MAG: hypothetical protein MRY57_00515 [Candidatus Pacebacteria bacterium]|nr:hypothetical protein [Candidatus Paceibacterota bacterium]